MAAEEIQGIQYHFRGSNREKIEAWLAEHGEEPYASRLLSPEVIQPLAEEQQALPTDPETSSDRLL